jgi:hypothetical protein
MKTHREPTADDDTTLLADEQRSTDRWSPGCVLPAAFLDVEAGVRISGVLVDLSAHGVRLMTHTSLHVGASLRLLTLHGPVALKVVWLRRTRHASQRLYGLRCVDATVDLADLFSHYRAA